MAKSLLKSCGLQKADYPARLNLVSYEGAPEIKDWDNGEIAEFMRIGGHSE